MPLLRPLLPRSHCLSCRLTLLGTLLPPWLLLLPLPLLTLLCELLSPLTLLPTQSLTLPLSCRPIYCCHSC